MLDNLRLLAMFYWNPRRAASETLDHARLGVTAVLAVLTAFALQGPGYLAERNAMIKLEVLASEAAQLPKDSPERAKAVEMYTEESRNIDFEDALGLNTKPIRPLPELLMLGGVLVPMGISLLTLWDGRRTCSAALGTEYGSIFLCAVASWTAARLPLVPLQFLPWQSPWPYWISTALFVVFLAVCFGVALGARRIPAVTASVAGAAVLAGGGLLAGAFSPFLWMLASPCLLYYLWGNFGAGATAVGATVSSRQSFRRALEATTINPRDADAQHQLGLIQLARHNLADAEARFRKASEIDKDDAEYAFYLGRALSEQGRHEEALPHFERAAKLNDRAVASEVWREIGASRLALGKHAEALEPLTCYVDRREYDPIGLVHLGEALQHAGRSSEARQMFERAIEAARTMPSHRRGEMRPWAGRARNALGSLV
jgi:Tfp pilus assembly protein PilF